DRRGVMTGEARYGSEKAGLLCGYLFREGEPGCDIGAEHACTMLADPAAPRWLQQRLALPEAFHTALDQTGSTRVEIAGESIVAVINDVTLFGLDASNVSAMALCVDSRKMVSARHTPLR